ncbi:hypothetical protein ACOMHN_047203 [Nucella lapillus]
MNMHATHSTIIFLKIFILLIDIIATVNINISFILLDIVITFSVTITNQHITIFVIIVGAIIIINNNIIASITSITITTYIFIVTNTTIILLLLLHILNFSIIVSINNIIITMTNTASSDTAFFILGIAITYSVTITNLHITFFIIFTIIVTIIYSNTTLAIDITTDTTTTFLCLMIIIMTSTNSIIYITFTSSITNLDISVVYFRISIDSMYRWAATVLHRDCSFSLHTEVITLLYSAGAPPGAPLFIFFKGHQMSQPKVSEVLTGQFDAQFAEEVIRSFKEYRFLLHSQSNRHPLQAKYSPIHRPRFLDPIQALYHPKKPGSQRGEVVIEVCPTMLFLLP